MKNIITIIVASILCISCGKNQEKLDYALQSAGDNRSQLEAVLDHYRNNPEKLAAARFLIENMPAHYSYKGKDIYRYYDFASKILSSGLTPEQQRDTLLAVSDCDFKNLAKHTVPDAQIITADFLIRNIDKAYSKWKSCSWAKQVSFDEFLEWILPYKAIELQELDGWRDTLQSHFANDLKKMIPNDVEYGTTMSVADIVKNETRTKMKRYGLYTRSGHPLLSAYLLPRQTFGDIKDYALIGTLVFRSMGIPVVLDETPVGPRYEAATRWFVILGDKGEEEASEWDLSTLIGWGFFPYERGPKVYRNTYAINPERMEYRKHAVYVYPFDLGKKDITEKYFLVSNLSLSVNKDIHKQLKDKYVYIASSIKKKQNNNQDSASVPQDSIGWSIVDFGKMEHGKACFSKMGREVLYLVFGYNGKKLIPITKPFILHKNNCIQYVSIDTINSQHLNKWRNQSL